MTDTEKMAELLMEAETAAAERGFFNCFPNEKVAAFQADFLIANGVTLATDTNAGSKWISVEDDLPKRSKNNFEEYIVRVTRSHWPTSSYDPVDAPYDEEYTTSACYDCDQKVWHLTRGEVVLNALLKPEDAPLNGEVVTHWMPMPTR